MEEKTANELMQYMDDVLNEVRQMRKDLSTLDTFSHYNQFVGALMPTGILGAIREGIENKKLQKYLSTKIYKDMSYDEIGYKIVDIARDLSETHAKVQKMIPKEDKNYDGYASNIVEVLSDCLATWKQISPEVAMEEITQSDGKTIQLGPTMLHKLYKEFDKMDTPSYFLVKEILRKIEHPRIWDNDVVLGCGVLILIFAVIWIISSIIKAFSN
ncbi:MAG: hypothetical protein IKP73_06425 [Bacteroidales bacterium]|nr:hypothetical protein [Bacteroidales bacterium]MBR4325144.1 hypothetical protein [Bacteroidales bacterium]